MARTALTLRNLPRNGANLITEAADTLNGNYIPFSGPGVFLLSFFSNTGGTVTISSPVYIDGEGASGGIKSSDRVLTLTPGTVFLWTCPMALYNQPALNQVFIDAAQATSIAVYQF